MEFNHSKSEGFAELSPYMAQEVREQNLLAILEAAQEKFGEHIRLAEFSRLIHQLVATRDPRLVLPEREAVEEVPLTRSGLPMNAGQLKWHEYESWAADPTRSSKELRARARSDAGFRHWFDTMRSREGVDTTTVEVNGVAMDMEAQIVNARPVQNISQAERSQLVEFANRVKIMSSSEVRKWSQRATNPEFETFNRNYERAQAAGLLL